MNSFDIFWIYSNIDNLSIKKSAANDGPISSLIADVTEKTRIKTGEFFSRQPDLERHHTGDTYIKSARICVAILSPSFVKDEKLVAEYETARALSETESKPLITIAYRHLLPDSTCKIDFNASDVIQFSPEDYGKEGRRQTEPFQRVNKDAYTKKVDEVAGRIIAELKKQNTKENSDINNEDARAPASILSIPAEIIDPDKFKVLLIYNETESQLVELGNLIISRLARHPSGPVQILGMGSYQRTVGRKEAFMRALDSCNLVVHLLGDHPGDTPDWAPDGIVRWMAKRTDEHPKRSSDDARLRGYLKGEMRGTFQEDFKLYHNWLNALPKIIAASGSTEFEMTVEEHVRKEIEKLHVEDRMGLGIFPGQSRWNDLANLRAELGTLPGGYMPIRHPFHDETAPVDSVRKSLETMIDRSEALLFLSGSNSLEAKMKRDDEMVFFLKHISKQRTKRAPPAAICLHGNDQTAERTDYNGDYAHIRFVDCQGFDLQDNVAARKTKDAIIKALDESGKALRETEKRLR